LTVEVILAWADAFHTEAGGWPTQGSGAIPGTRETWGGVDGALRRGLRGLPGGASLARLLDQQRGVPNPADRPALTVALIRRWARLHRRRTGPWPSAYSGAVADAPGAHWSALNTALKRGCRAGPA
jgi:hypothetical protein